MALSELQQAEVNQRLCAFCAARVPLGVRNQVRLGFAAPSFKRLLDEVAADPTGIFWG